MIGWQITLIQFSQPMSCFNYYNVYISKLYLKQSGTVLDQQWIYICLLKQN